MEHFAEEKGIMQTVVHWSSFYDDVKLFSPLVVSLFQPPQIIEILVLS
jgi:hypothetical protein